MDFSSNGIEDPIAVNASIEDFAHNVGTWRFAARYGAGIAGPRCTTRRILPMGFIEKLQFQV